MIIIQRKKEIIQISSPEKLVSGSINYIECNMLWTQNGSKSKKIWTIFMIIIQQKKEQNILVSSTEKLVSGFVDYIKCSMWRDCPRHLQAKFEKDKQKYKCTKQLSQLSNITLLFHCHKFLQFMSNNIICKLRPWILCNLEPTSSNS